ncbi:MAG: GntR family transcriptional regulator [Anaerolineae bacterium]
MADRNSESNYKAIKRPAHLSLADIAYNGLVEAIINQEFQPGEALSIDSLARQLNMSNTPVREALMRAHGERLVTQKANYGFVVSELLTPEELRQLFEVRRLLEIRALELAPLPLASAAVDNLRHLVAQMLHAPDGAVYNDYKDYLQLDHQFHHQLVSLSDNSFLIKAWEDLHVHLHLSRLYRGVGLFDRTDSAEEHRALLEALETDNREQVINLMGQHIQGVRDRVEKHFLT